MKNEEVLVIHNHPAPIVQNIVVQNNNGLEFWFLLWWLGGGAAFSFWTFMGNLALFIGGILCFVATWKTIRAISRISKQQWWAARWFFFVLACCVAMVVAFKGADEQDLRKTPHATLPVAAIQAPAPISAGLQAPRELPPIIGQGQNAQFPPMIVAARQRQDARYSEQAARSTQQFNPAGPKGYFPGVSDVIPDSPAQSQSPVDREYAIAEQLREEQGAKQ